MTNIKEIRDACRAFAVANLSECCAELIEWQDTAILRDGRVRELAAMCDGFISNNDGLRVAESFISRAAIDVAAKAAPVAEALTDLTPDRRAAIHAKVLSTIGDFEPMIGPVLAPETPAEPMPPAWPAYGIIDPDYARYYSIIRATTWQYGYAIGMHGSFTRDLDLIAAPWADDARDPDLLIKVIVSRTDLTEQHSNPGTKPHGRKIWTLLLPGFGDPRWIDLSIVPRVAAAAEPSLQE